MKYLFSRRTLYSLFFLVLLGFIWGSGYSIARYVRLHSIATFSYAYWQSLGPAIFLLFYLFFTGLYRQFSIQHWFFYLLIGIFGIVIPNSVMYFVAPHLSAGILAVIVNTVSLIVYPLALFLRQERFHWIRLVCVLLGIIGILLIIFSKLEIHWLDLNRWALLALLTPISFACCALYISKSSPKEISPFVLAAGMLIFSSILLTPITFGLRQFHPLHLLSSYIDWLIILEIILSSVGYVILFTLLQKSGSVYYSLVGGVVALTGLFWGHLIFHEYLNLVLVVAISLIIIAILIMTWHQEYIRRYENRT